MPPLWTPSGGASNPSLSANDVGTQAMPAMQMAFQPVDQVARSQTGYINPEYATSLKSGRPYADVGKMSLSLAQPGSMSQSVVGARGFLEGFGAGAGRLIGGFVPGGGQIGADIGQGIGHIAQIPLDVGANVLGAIPAIPFGMPGALATDQERQDALAAAHGNPFTMFRMLQNLDQESWQQKITSGEVSPLFQHLGPAKSLGDQVMGMLGILGVPSQLLERGWAGGPGNAIKRIMDRPIDSLSPELQDARQAFQNGAISQNQFLDKIVMNGAGYSDNWIANLVAEMVADPANLLMGAGAAIGLASKGAKAEQAMRFVDYIGKGAGDALARSVAEQTLADTGRVVAEDAITPLQKIAEAQRLGQHGDAIAEVTSRLDAQTRLALHPAFGRMETVANVAQSVLNPFNAIGAKGSKPLENAYLSRESTRGVANYFGLGTWGAVSDRMDRIGLGHLFDQGMGYFAAQEGVLIAGDNLKNDIAHIRQLSSAMPNDVVLARARVGAENYAQQMERWLSDRGADLARLTGGTKEEALARAENQSIDRLIRMGATDAQARGIVKGIGEKGYNLIDAMYYGHRIASYNVAKRAAQEAVAATLASATSEAATKAAQTVQNLVDRLTLIGSRELTYERAQTLKEAVAEYERTGSAAAMTSIKDAVRQYDRLAYGMLADGTPDAELAAHVKAWIKEFEPELTHEADISTLPDAIKRDAALGDGYVYGLRPADGLPQWRLAFHEADVVDVAGNVTAKAGDIKYANPWVDTVGDAAQPWNLRFRDNGGGVHTFVNALERTTRFMGQQISSDRIDREARQAFVQRAMGGWAKPKPGMTGTGLTYGESKTLYEAVKTRAMEATTSPRGLMINEVDDIIKASPAAQRVGLTAAELQLLTLQSFEGNVGTVGLTQKLTGVAKVKGTGIPLLPANTLGMMAERLYPLARFTVNPFFQLQEWVEPWVFSWARGEQARLAHGWIDPITGEKVTLESVDLIQQHLISRYRASNPASQFDMMERSMAYLYGQKAAKQAAAATDRTMIGNVLAGLRLETTHGRKHAAQSAMFQHFLGPMLREQFDRINPNIWLDLEQEFGTKNAGQIATRWLIEKDRWANADPRVAYHLMDATKEASMGARAAVNLEENARVVFKTNREALNIQIGNETMTHDMFVDTMRELGAHPEYIDKSWKAHLFEVKTGGAKQWYADAAKYAPGGAKEVEAVRRLFQAVAEVHGISETELLSRTLQRSPVSLLHDDLLAMSEGDLNHYDILLQQGQNMLGANGAATAFLVDDVTGAVTRNPMFKGMAEKQFLEAAKNPPSFIPAHMIGDTANMQRVAFRDANGVGRDVFIPGGLKALKDLETPWTPWEAHVIRAQMLNPADMIGDELKNALDEKMWRGHTYDMADVRNIHKTFNNYVFAMHSANMSLTRNELIASRFRVSSLEDIHMLASESLGLRSVIEDSHPGAAATDSELGLAYSTNRDVAHYIPLDNRHAYYHDGMLPDRMTTVKENGKEVVKHVDSTQSLIERRAQAAGGYLRGTSIEQRGVHARLLEAQVAFKKTLTTAQKKAYKPPDRMEHWAIDQITAAHVDGIMVDGKRVMGWDAIDHLPPELGIKRAAKFTPDQRVAVEQAVATLAEDPMNVEARNALRPFTTVMKDHDQNVIFKGWNVSGAGLPAGEVNGEAIAHGDKELFAYLKNDDVSWRGTATNENMGRTLAMAEDMSANPDFYTRRARLWDGRPVEVRDGHMKVNIDGEWYSRGRIVSPGEQARIKVRGEALMNEATSRPVRPLSFATDNRDQLVDQLFAHSRGEWDGYTVSAVDGSVPPADAITSGISTTVSIKSTSSREEIAAAVDKLIKDDGNSDHLGRQDFYIGIFHDPDKATIDLDLNVALHVPTEADAEAIQLHLGRTGGAYNFATGNGIYAPILKSEATHEPLDQFGERISHRIPGLQMKTGFFGTDLGNPLEFGKGVHDLHMVGDLTEWMYDRTAKGTTKEWTDWLGSLSDEKQKLITKWIDEGANHGAGAFGWEEAAGVPISFKPGKEARTMLASASTSEKAAWVRRQLEDDVADPKKPLVGTEQRDRLYQMYRTDAELADLVDREIHTYGGDYKVFEDTMTRRKALASESNPWLDRHGNGGYQWKLWDERRHVWDPETSAFNLAHEMPRQSTRYMASSDDVHNLAGFYNKLGQPSVLNGEYSYLDPIRTVMMQKDGKMIRGATITLDTGEKIVGFTKYRNRTTLLHEMTHAVLEPILDPSAKQVVLDDINRVIDERNALIVPGGATYEGARTAVADATDAVDNAATVLQQHTQTHAIVQATAVDARAFVKKSEDAARAASDAVLTQQGKVAQLAKDEPAARKAIAALTAPSSRARETARLDKRLATAKDDLTRLTAQRDTLLKGVQPARDAATQADEQAAAALGAKTEAATAHRAALRAQKAATDAFDEIGKRPLELQKTGWDRATSEHFADEFGRWLATGKATNPKLRDTFAYFRNVLLKIKTWLDGQPGQKVSPEMQKLFEDLTTPQTREATLMANAVPFDATQEMMHAAGIQSVVDAENAAFQNVQFKRSRSWLERSINHPYFGIYPSSYMWGKVAPEMVRGLARNPFGLPIPILTKPVKLGAHEYGLHGSPFYGFVNAQRAWNSVEMQKTSDPKFDAQFNDPKNQKVWSNLNMFLPATPWDIPANFPLWSRRISEWGLNAQQAHAEGRLTKEGQPYVPSFDLAKTAGEVASYGFGLKATADWISQTGQIVNAPMISGAEPKSLGGVTASSLSISPTGQATIQQTLSEAQQQLQQGLDVGSMK